MKIGWIGAGKVGESLARYFSSHNLTISGFYNRTKRDNSFPFPCMDSIEQLVLNSDILFLTVTDTAISLIWQQLKNLPIQNKIICHCSGSLPSDIFSDYITTGVFACSMHPMLAFDSGQVSFAKLSNAFFTIEGHPKAISALCCILEQCHNPYKMISSKEKAKYHAASVFASNFVTGICSIASTLLTECGFSEQEALTALTPLIKENIDNFCQRGFVQSLTGPIERGDCMTLQKHLDSLKSPSKELYLDMIPILLNLAKKKHPNRDFSSIEQFLK